MYYAHHKYQSDKYSEFPAETFQELVKRLNESEGARDPKKKPRVCEMCGS